MKKAIGILIIFTIKSVTGDDTIQKEEPTSWSNMTIQETQDDQNQESVHRKNARSISDTSGCSYSCSICGSSNSRKRLIGGGNKVNPPNKYPWLVYLLRGKAKRKSICGGVLISEDFILTAAHCCLVKDSRKGMIMTRSLKIYFTTKLSSKLTKGPAMEKAYPHPGYSGRRVHDICLIKMKKKVRCNENISPICLPNANLELSPGQNIFVAGWGRAEIKGTTLKEPVRELFEAEMQIAPANECSGYNQVSPYLMCVVPHKKQFTCQGDSGVPFFRMYQGRYFVVAIYNGRRGRFCSDSPKIANSIPKHIKWIQQVTGINPDYPVSRAGERFAMEVQKDGREYQKEDQGC